MRRRTSLAWLAGFSAAVLGGCGAAPRPTATRLPPPGPAPADLKPIAVTRGPSPTPVPGSRPPRAARVRMRQEYWLLEAPRPDAQRLRVGLLGTARDWEAREEVDGWVRIDAGPFTGWAPESTVEFVG
jgi:hypothetical protein